MGKTLAQTFVTTDLREHPAVRAWSEARRVRLVPESIRILKDRNNSRVYRLAGVGPEGCNIVAKQCPKANASAERFIYEKVLPHLPFVAALQCYGFLEEQNTEFCWFFMEDAEGVPYSPEIEEHSVLAAVWLGRLHTCGVKAAAGLSLSDRGPDYYLGCLRLARERIRQNLANPALNHDDRDVLTSILHQCDGLAQRWDQIEEWCVRIPRTFVHADLCLSNVRVRPAHGGPGLVVFDWETAGWGALAVDLVLAGLDLPTYHSLVRRLWPSVNLEALRKCARLGRVFRLLGFVECESTTLAGEWLHKPMKHMRCYRTELSDAIRVSGLEA
jgi:Phosphotransferase enzyme family